MILANVAFAEATATKIDIADADSTVAMSESTYLNASTAATTWLEAVANWMFKLFVAIATAAITAIPG